MADAAKAKFNIFKRSIKFFKELRSEIKKIVWPDKKQVANNTAIVIAVIIIVGAGIWIIDALLGMGLFAAFGR